MAGMAVDTILFPLDTFKTRLQSPQGFWKAGGFRGVYSGLSSAFIGSAPSAGLFFTSYELLKRQLPHMLPNLGPESPATHLVAASGGEVAACLIRVPTEVVKQRMQTGQYRSLGSALSSIFSSAGIAGFYRGFGITVFREIPFACIQFPLYERLKLVWAARKGRAIASWEAGLCGMVAGGTAAGLTTPLDVIKTRTMLSYATAGRAFATILRSQGPGALLSGLGPRVMWISLGGAIFLGVYEQARGMMAGQDRS
ncbi:mitochondrial carrier domain-containing protein [Hyaloraphidium curvatum]|nr:mitochondrial carrier domain-containing protein [Hyaloraphidium curvatum]